MTLSNRQSGYALLMTLLLLVIAAAAMVGMSRRSMAQALAAVSATEEIQNRWLLQSCRSAILPQVESILSRHSLQHRKPTLSLDARLQLAHRSVLIRLTDEQAKANVNALLAQRGLLKAEDAVRFLRADRGGELAVRLRPGAAAPVSSASPISETSPALTTWNQLYLPLSGSHPLDDGQATDVNVAYRFPLMDATTQVTLWGDGRLNIRRTTSAVLDQVASPWLDAGDADRLIALRDSAPGLGIDHLLEQLQLTDLRRRRLHSLLTDKSYCHSLWIVTDSALGSEVEFNVLESVSNRTQHHRFVW